MSKLDRGLYMLPTNWRVNLAGTDINREDIESISDISSGLDISNPIEFNTGTARIQTKGTTRSGLVNHAEVKIYAGSKLIFSGKVIKIDKDVKGRVSDWIVSDESQLLRSENIEDFGILKRVRVTPVADTDSGEYPFTNNLSPVSDKSLKNPRSGTDALTVVDYFLTEGNLDNKNINYDSETLRSEEKKLDDNPDVTIKAPYRWKTVLFIVNKILEHYNISNSLITVDKFTTDKHFSTNGRVAYDLENNENENTPLAQGRETALFWTGHVTDFLVEGTKFYFLYSSRTGLPSIIEYDTVTDEYAEIYKRSTHAEWWKFVKDGDDFYILGTTKSTVVVDNPTLGAYDPTESGSATFIEKLDTSTDPSTLSTYISSSHDRPPVVGMYYQMGFEVDGAENNVRQGIQPDTRKGFILDSDNLYYIFADSNSCGIAKATASDTTTAFVTIPRDDYFNHLGLDFTIDSDVLYGGAVFQRETEASRIIFKKDL